ncbi:hypothetical protein OG609_43055 [Streptomyces sp. NBC_01224]|uniref:hypothetical protein n=1 Tax=Streptomyces sp. NBC_01224 TaxID=2903783 RepID=UPI002E0DF4DD|nr:hypothetical protein OG609_43055 [Streptomyces sp. NBC_01224]
MSDDSTGGVPGRDEAERAEFHGPTAVQTGAHSVQHNHFHTAVRRLRLGALPWAKSGGKVDSFVSTVVVLAFLLGLPSWWLWHENQEKERQNSIVTVCGQTRNAYGQLAASYSIHGLGKDSNGTRRAFAHQVDEAAGATSDSKLAKLLKSQSADTSGYADAVERNDKTAVQRYAVQSQSSAQALLDYCRAKASIDVY